eukprot:14682582-Alexandrium_andersonii.AAC.1
MPLSAWHVTASRRLVAELLPGLRNGPSHRPFSSRRTPHRTTPPAPPGARGQPLPPVAGDG